MRFVNIVLSFSEDSKSSAAVLDKEQSSGGALWKELATRKSAADDPVSTTFFGLVESLVGDLDEGFDNIVRLQLGGG